MAQQVWLVRVTLTSRSTLVDNPTNEFVIEQTGSTTALIPATVKTLITNFYNVTHPGSGSPLSAYINPIISRSSNACLISAYDITSHLDGTPHGAPVYTDAFTLGNAAAADKGWPEGLCALLSYRADYGSDIEFEPGARPRARDRGRLFVGPMRENLTTVDGSGRCIWDPTQLVAACLETAYAAMCTYGGSADVPAAVQWSRKAARVQHITTIWTQDCPRYQRRRVDPGNRT